MLRQGKLSARTGAFRGFLFGLGANLVALRFVPEVITRFTGLPAAVAWLALVLLSAAQAIPWAIGAAIPSLVSRWAPRVPAWLAFGAGVYGATFVPAVFPWTPAGGLAPWPVLVQTAELVGERGTTFLFALVAGLLADAIDAGASKRAPRAIVAPLGVAATLLALVCGWGFLRIREIEHVRAGAKTAKVALLQPDFDAFDRWNDKRAAFMLDRLTKLTKLAEERGAVLTVWPESAYPYTLAHGTRHAPSGERAVLQPGLRGPVLTGAYLTKGHGLGTNAAILATEGGALSRPYDKRHLLWFGETVPLADTFPVLRRVFARGTGLVPGTESIAFEAGPIVAAVLNCYEDTLPQAGREAMEVKPNLLVNVTNDAWFAGSAEGELHLRLSVLRAVETRRDLVRAVNRGPTSHVGASGRILARRDPFPPPPPLLVDAALLDGPPTLFVRFGDAPLVIAIVLALLVPAIRARRARAHKSNAGATP